MKWLMLCFTFLMKFCSFTNAEAKEERAKKIYLNPQKILVCETKIVYRTSHGDLPIRSLQSDERGIYTKIKRSKTEEKGKVYCPRCKRYVDEGDVWHWLNH